MKFAIAFLLLALPGCQRDMENQPRYEPLEQSAFPGFENNLSSRHLIAGTVARGQFRHDDPVATGRDESGPLETNPLEIDRQLLDRGRQRYDIHCSMCHDRAGYGDGIVVRTGYPRPPSFHIDRLRQSPPGHYFRIITDGYGRMPHYADQVPPHDRWAIAAYIQALQLSQNATAEDLPEDLRQQLDDTQTTSNP